MGAFDYPSTAISRRHGPQGYAAYPSYRPWLRDEFTFRCVYCLKREQWGSLTGDFDLDHFQPQSTTPERSTDYDNLVYSCHSCNLRKKNDDVPDPCECLTTTQVRVNHVDGSLEGQSDEATKVILILGLNSEKYKHFRLIWIRIVDLARTENDLYSRLMGFPDDLPDLSRLIPPGKNSRSGGVDQSYYARRQSGELPATY